MVLIKGVKDGVELRKSGHYSLISESELAKHITKAKVEIERQQANFVKNRVTNG